jgi:hypothetical protein
LGSISRAVVYGWVDTDSGFARAYERAELRGADAIADLAHRLVATATSENANVVRLQIDQLRWRAARLSSKYAPPQAVDPTAAAAASNRAVDLSEVRGKLIAKLDEIHERIEADDRRRYRVTRLIADRLREVEEVRSLDPVSDRDDILAICGGALAPGYTPPASEAGE